MNAPQISPYDMFKGDSREAKLIRLVDSCGEHPMSAEFLMQRLRIPREGAIGFINFINLSIRARQLLEHYGFRLMRTGGTPSDKYWIEPQGRSS